MKVLIIIPAYNEKVTIEETVKNCKKMGYDVCCVNDCSKDDTSAICHSINEVCVLDLPFNLGIGGAVQTGYRWAYRNNYDVAVQIDGDGQHDPRFINDLLQPIFSNEADMVVGSRFISYEGFQSSYMRRCGINFICGLLNFFYNTNIKDVTSGFRACNKMLIKMFSEDYPVDFPEPETNARLLRMGYKIKEIPVIMMSRKGGHSSITNLKSVWYMVKVILAICVDYFRR